MNKINKVSVGAMMLVMLLVGIAGPLAVSAADAPMISVMQTSSANGIVLPYGGADVVRAYVVSNIGTVAMSNVVVSDDSCNPVFGPEGDVNRNGLLDTNETWFYACRNNVAVTTTNTFRAEGQANGLTTRVASNNTIVVAVPGFPNTGLSF